MDMSEVTTGLKGLDKLINGLQIGDNVVWQIENIEDYRHFVIPFVKRAVSDNKKVIYIRFTQHKSLVKPGKNVVIHKIDAFSGFESFSTELNRIIGQSGQGVYYVFDCLSELLPAWSTDLMIGNFFKIICPYLFALNTIAYFSIMRNRHSFTTVARIREITQLLIDVYHYEKNYFVHPLKVWNRYSPTMFLPHLQKRDSFVPLTSSIDVAKLFASIGERSTKSAKLNLDYWDQLFLQAEELVNEKAGYTEQKEMAERLSRIMLAKDERLLLLIQKHFGLADIIDIKSRLIGTGYVGGKAVGMLLARKIMANDQSLNWQKYLEPHDSYYIGSDVFYTYIVQNGWWKLRLEQKTKEGYFKIADGLKELLLTGEFSEEIKAQFRQMIEYFGQAPIIVRSSSLLEDAFGNAFAGKYESVFCANQGTSEERYREFEQVVRRIYASTMNKDALEYRLQRGLAQQDEQMALLVQRVSGAYHRRYFFPDLAGVGISYNTYIWKKGMDPKGGMLRLVFGLGTRAVNRVEVDYPRLVALDEPLSRPHGGAQDAQRFSQHSVDVINIEKNVFETISFNELAIADLGIDLHSFAETDEDAARLWKERGRNEREFWILSLNEVVRNKTLITTMQQMLKILEEAYQYPVDTEYTVNFRDKSFQINLLQCRPHQTQGLGTKVHIPQNIAAEKIVFATHGYFVGGNVNKSVKRLIYVDAEYYDRLAMSAKYDIARLIGELNRLVVNKDEEPTALLGPGRWGTSTPSLGIPVSFSEINNMILLGEVSFTGGAGVPEISFGTHFFQDLVETGIFYLVIVPGNKDVFLNKAMIKKLPNLLTELLPDYRKFREVVKVIDLQKKRARLMADIVTQRAVLFCGEPR